MKELEDQSSSKDNLYISREKERIHLAEKVKKLSEELENVEMWTMVKFSKFREYFNELGTQYACGCEHFHAQV